MTAHARNASRRVLACLLAGLALPASAVGLGELSVHSALGEPLDATVALTLAQDAKPVPGCFSLARARATGLPAVPRPTFAVEPDGSGWRLRIRTRGAVGEPASQLRLNAACEGQEATSRDYEVLLDPRPAETPTPALRTLPGDTLASLAHAIYPKRRTVRDAYVQALRAANPAIAGLGADEPIPPDTAVVLPDLRRFSMSLAVSPPAPRPALPVVKPQTELAPAEAFPPKTPPRAAPPKQSPASAPPAKTEAIPKPASPPPAKTEPAATPELLPATKAAVPAKAAAPPPAPKPAAPTPPDSKDGRFVLRLSSPEVDLSRSRGIDDRTRAQLRERLLILDADDQVAALLSMRNSLKQLESRVAELQLKLSTLPPTPVPAAVPSSKPAQATSPVAAPAAPTPPSVPAAKPAAAVTAPAPAPERMATPAPAPAPERAPAPVPETVVATPAPTVAAVAPSPEKTAPPPAKRATTAPPAPVVAPKDTGDFLSWLLWGIFATFLAALAAVGWSEFSRSRRNAPLPAPAPVPASAAPSSLTSSLAEAEALMSGGAPGRPAEAGHRVIADSDASLATSVPGADPVMLRRRYIEERFPEIANGSIILKDPDSVVKAARLFYEDGAIARAIELLQYTVEEMPASMKPWLALFEIFRLEGLAGEFAELAGRFRGHHGATDNWRKVQYIGRELDPGNALYREAPFNNLETIGPAAAKKQASITFDPFAENWLNAPMDFTTDALAASLRAGLLADAGVGDSDLVADPMPALKNVEMFNVA